MTPQELRDRTKTFAVAVIRLVRHMPKTDEARVITRQLLRAGTGVAANYRAACRARSDAEFVARIGTVVEECDEAAFWLELLADAAICSVAATQPELDEANQLLRLFVASRETVRRRLRCEKSQIANHKSQIR